MAISFKESISAIRCENEHPASVKRAMIASQSADDWTLDNRYEYYADYSDTSFSCIDAAKNIILDSKQINLTQEINSQFIPFEMPRYYDGFDLTNTNILIHFVNRQNDEDFDSPINVYYSADKIRFGWLVDGRVTAVDGVVRFEIQALGTNSLGEEYIWKTKPSNALSVLKSLVGNGIIEPDDSWMTSIMSQVGEHVAMAKMYAEEAKAAAEASGSGNNVKIELDTTLTQSGMAADAKAVGDKILSLPVSISDDGYSEVKNQRKITQIQSIKSNDKVSVIATLEGNKNVVIDIDFNANNYPISMTVNDRTVSFMWSGF